MGREILYKGKRTDTKEWIGGCLLIDYVSGQYFIHASGNCLNESDKVGEEGCLKFFAYEVDPETICQYTCYTDLRKKNAFENDIIFYEDRNRHGHIVFKEGRFLIEWEEGRSDLRSDIHFWFTERRVYVVGNVFDTPNY